MTHDTFNWLSLSTNELARKRKTKNETMPHIVQKELFLINQKQNKNLFLFSSIASYGRKHSMLKIQLNVLCTINKITGLSLYRRHSRKKIYFRWLDCFYIHKIQYSIIVRWSEFHKVWITDFRALEFLNIFFLKLLAFPLCRMCTMKNIVTATNVISIIFHKSFLILHSRIH